jgi:hypothetical protein
LEDGKGGEVAKGTGVKRSIINWGREDTTMGGRNKMNIKEGRGVRG